MHLKLESAKSIYWVHFELGVHSIAWTIYLISILCLSEIEVKRFDKKVSRLDIA